MEQGIPTAQAMTIDPETDQETRGSGPVAVDNHLTRTRTTPVWFGLGTTRTSAVVRWGSPNRVPVAVKSAVTSIQKIFATWRVAGRQEDATPEANVRICRPSQGGGATLP